MFFAGIPLAKFRYTGLKICLCLKIQNFFCFLHIRKCTFGFCLMSAKIPFTAPAAQLILQSAYHLVKTYGFTTSQVDDLKTLNTDIQARFYTVYDIFDVSIIPK